jgi:hypothetical protein
MEPVPEGRLRVIRVQLSLRRGGRKNHRHPGAMYRHVELLGRSGRWRIIAVIAA